MNRAELRTSSAMPEMNYAELRVVHLEGKVSCFTRKLKLKEMRSSKLFHISVLISLIPLGIANFSFI